MNLISGIVSYKKCLTLEPEFSDLTLGSSIIPSSPKLIRKQTTKVHTASRLPSKTANEIGGSLLPKGWLSHAGFRVGILFHLGGESLR